MQAQTNIKLFRIKSNYVYTLPKNLHYKYFDKVFIAVHFIIKRVVLTADMTLDIYSLYQQ